MAAAPASTAVPGNALQLLPLSLANQGAQLLPTSLAKAGASLLPTSLAATLANTQFNPAISSALAQVQAGQAGGAQALANLHNWYSQILASQQQAGAQDQSLDNTTANAEASNNAGILASLGGAANKGASSVATAGQNNLGTLQALSAISGQYNANMIPLLQLAQAGAEGAQQQSNNNYQAQDLLNVQNLLGERGATQAQNEMNILNQNNSIRDAQAQRLVDILGANNQTRDNRVNALSSIIGANNNTILQGQNLTAGALQNKLAVMLAAGYDPTTGGLSRPVAMGIAQMLGMDPNALIGNTSANDAARTATTTQTNQTKLATTGMNDTTKVRTTGMNDQTKLVTTGMTDQNRVTVQGMKAPTGTISTNDATKWAHDLRYGTSEDVTTPNKNSSTGYSNVRSQVGQMTYQQALDAANRFTGIERARRINAINSTWEPGQGGRPYTDPQQAMSAASQQVAAAQAHGWSAAQITKSLNDSGLFPKGVVDQAVYNGYFSGPRSPIQH